MEGEDKGIANREVTQGRFETSSTISQASVVNALPTRLMRLATLPWFECWAGQLRTEKKSKHTIRAYTVAARDFSTTVLPGEDNLSWEQAQIIPVRVYHERSDPSTGRVDAWLNSLGELRPATINARIAAVSHLLKWLGYTVPEWVQRPARRRPLPRPLGRSEVLKVRSAALRMEDPLALSLIHI